LADLRCHHRPAVFHRSLIAQREVRDHVVVIRGPLGELRQHDGGRGQIRAVDVVPPHGVHERLHHPVRLLTRLTESTGADGLCAPRAGHHDGGTREISIRLMDHGGLYSLVVKHRTEQDSVRETEEPWLLWRERTDGWFGA